ncbi:MAG TPA: iron ABC transporter permease [Candidatus Binatia bacterium]
MAGTPTAFDESVGGEARTFRLRDVLARFIGPYTAPLFFSWLVLGGIVFLSLVVLYMSFIPFLPIEPGYTLEHWTNLARPYFINRVLPNTLIVGTGTVLVALFFAGPTAWLLNRTALPGRNLFIALMAVVVLIPGFVKAMGWILLINPRIGILNNFFAGLFGVETVPLSLANPYGMAWVMGLSLTPSMFFLISGPMRSLDPALEEAASVLGANRWWTFLKVGLPLVWPAILGGSIYHFMTALSMFEVPAMLGAAGGQAPVLATELFYSVRPATGEATMISYGAAGVYGVLIAAPSLVALYYYHRVLEKGHRYAVISGKGYRPKEHSLGAFKYPALAFVLLYIFLAAVMPMLVLGWMSLFAYVRMPSWEALSSASLRNYNPEYFMAIIGGPQVIWNTVKLLVTVPVLVLFFSITISWLVVRTRVRLRGLMDNIAMLPHAIPGLAFAFSLFIVALLLERWVPWFELLGTILIIAVANLMERLTYSTRITNASLIQIQRELEESAHVCGARTGITIWRILIPLIKPSLVFAALWTTLLTFREVSMALFLSGPRNQVLSVGVWLAWDAGNIGSAAAGAVVMVLAVGLILLLTLPLTGGRLTTPRLPGSTGRHS